MAMFFGTISPTTMWRKTTIVSATISDTVCSTPSGTSAKTEHRPLEPVGDRRLGHRAKRKRRHRDPELRAGQLQRQLPAGGDGERARRSPASASASSFVRRDAIERELDRDEEPVRHEQETR